MSLEQGTAQSREVEKPVSPPERTSPTTTERTTTPRFGRDVDSKPFIKCFAVGCAYTSTWRQNIRLHARRCHPDQWRFRPPGWSSPTGRTRAGRRRDEVLSEIRSLASTPPNPAKPTEREPTVAEVEEMLASLPPLDGSRYETPLPDDSSEKEDP